MKLDHRRVALALSGVRIANGLLLSLAPSAAGALYLGPGGSEPTARALARFTGARDVVLGVGAIVGVSIRERDAELVAAGAACEGIDFFVSLFSRGLSTRTRIAAPSAAAGALAGMWAARHLAADRRAASPDRPAPVLPV
jgi:hypothetical protein